MKLRLGNGRVPLAWNRRWRNHSLSRLPVRDMLIVVAQLSCIGRHIDRGILMIGDWISAFVSGPAIRPHLIVSDTGTINWSLYGR